jgi:hypothetical protein
MCNSPSPPFPPASSWLPLSCWLSLLLPAWTWSAAAMRSARPLPSTALLKMHVRTLRLNPTAATRPPYTMRMSPLRLVPRA